MKTSHKILQAMQEINSATTSFLVLKVDYKFIEKIEKSSTDSKKYKKQLKEIDAFCDRIIKDIQDYSAISGLRQSFSEIFVQKQIGEKFSVFHVPENTDKSPDLEVVTPSGTVYVEIKAPTVSGGELGLRTIMENGLEGRITAEGQSRNEGVGFGETEIAPLKGHNEDYDPRSIKYVAEWFIKKISQNIKRDQFSKGETFLLLDINFHLPLLCAPEEGLNRYFTEQGTTMISGDIFHICLGTIGDDLYRFPEFPGESNEDGKLERNGILIEYPYISGLIFKISETYYCIALKERMSAAGIDFITKICKKANIV